MVSVSGPLEVQALAAEDEVMDAAPHVGRLMIYHFAPTFSLHQGSSWFFVMYP